MKRKTRIGALLLTLVGVGAGEAWGQNDLVVGPRAGVVISTLEFEDLATDAQTGTLVSVEAGLSVRRVLGRLFTAELGVQVAQEGFGGGGGHTGDLRRDRLAVPLLFSLRLPTRVSAHVTTGVSGKVAFRCRQTGVPVVGDVPCDDPVMGSRWRRLDVAGIGGVGVALPVGRRTLSTDVLFAWGLRDLNGGGHIPGGAHGVSVGISVALLAPWDAGRAGGGS